MRTMHAPREQAIAIRLPFAQTRERHRAALCSYSSQYFSARLVTIRLAFIRRHRACLAGRSSFTVQPIITLAFSLNSPRRRDSLIAPSHTSQTYRNDSRRRGGLECATRTIRSLRSGGIVGRGSRDARSFGRRSRWCSHHLRSGGSHGSFSRVTRLEQNWALEVTRLECAAGLILRFRADST